MMSKTHTKSMYKEIHTDAQVTLGSHGLTLLNEAKHANQITQFLLNRPRIPHLPQAGLNAIADAAAYLFCLMGRLKQSRTSINLNDLHQELSNEINVFRNQITQQLSQLNYSSEFVPVACYALCATLDDIILSTSWGAEAWQPFCLVSAFGDKSISAVNFFIILERLIREPNIYIDVMEFMYICLSLGFGSRNHAQAEFNHVQLEFIMSSLYKRIRAYRGRNEGSLSPYPIKLKARKFKQKKINYYYILAGAVILMTSFQLIKYWVFSGSEFNRVKLSWNVSKN